MKIRIKIREFFWETEKITDFVTIHHKKLTKNVTVKPTLLYNRRKA